ncbi:MAG: hypothetical protein J3K34DRAFT_435430 [Monoraphidium minutum]|nr:MAG: hypothetical protein J3K34DRAFT_435430 [Monoraphidium minutum]
MPKSSPGMASGDIAYITIQPKTVTECGLSPADVEALNGGVDAGGIHKAYATATRAVLRTASSMLGQLGAREASLLTVMVWLRDAEAGVSGFTEAWSEWIGDDEPPGVVVLEAKGPVPGVPLALNMTAYAGSDQD